MVTANRGEWSEIYCILKILAEKKIYIADANGRKNDQDWLSILDLMRIETKERIVRYKCPVDQTDVTVSVNETKQVTIPAGDFLKMAEALLDEIKSHKGVFSIPSGLQNQISGAGFTTVKASSHDKNDVYLTIFDPRSGVERADIGFSIKSDLGKASTLFNTARASALVYELSSNMTPELASEINTLTAIIRGKNTVAVSERFCKLIRKGIGMKFVGFFFGARAKCEVFKENLEMLNPRLPKFFDTALRGLVSKSCSSRNVSDVTEYVSTINPENLMQAQMKYEYMVKAFLYAAYCGMTASTLWNGRSDVNGGFIRVSPAGEVLAYYALESDSFKQHLFENSFFDFPDTGEKHGDYAKVYEENGKYYFKLNFQIRYKLSGK